MCLNTLWTKERTKEWLSKKSNPLIVYKTVQSSILTGGIYPIIQNTHGRYKKTNKVDKRTLTTVHTGRGNKPYKAGYHMCLTKKGAKVWFGKVLKCEVKKKDVLAIGTQNNHTAIVTREFTFIDEDEHFKDQNKE